MTIETKRTILVIEDNELNREMLCAILSPEYDVIQAENGAVGLELLSEYKSRISLILLDIQMPVMDGYEFLQAVRRKPRYANIPIIVTTSSANAMDEIHCLENGASDFVSKPYKVEVVLRRVSSLIRLSEASNIINRMEFDDLTEMYSKDFFYMRGEKLLQDSAADTHYDIVCSDIHALKVLNERYGISEVNKLLVSIANCFKEMPNALCGRIYADVFALLLPHHHKAYYQEFLDRIVKAIKESPFPNATVHLGIYRNVNRHLRMATICDNARLAVASIKHQYGNILVEYDEAFKKKLIREQMITDSFNTALEEKQFVIYYQPKYDLTKERVGGAEALVRWVHPELGFLSPGEFIPLFEKNGLIGTLDHYIAERVCSDIHEWMETGVPTVPISVNVSRVDFENPRLTHLFQNLVSRHSVPGNLLHIEVTESAYAENPEQIRNGVHKLREMGFRTELDDFGSGYSSLNVLDDLELDVLKLDMSLVRNFMSKKRKVILESVFSIAHRLGMEVVAEGIETIEQVEAFRAMGCKYAQGYYYSRPLCKEDFEKYLISVNKGE